MRYYSIIDDLLTSRSPDPEPINKHPITSSPVELKWEAQDFGGGDLPFPEVTSGIIFDSTTRGAKIDFSPIVDGFPNQFSLALTDTFSQNPSSDGQIRQFWILDDSDVGYRLTYKTVIGDNATFRCRLHGWDGVVQGLLIDETFPTPQGEFRIYFDLADGTLQVAFGNGLSFTSPEVSPYNFSKLIISGEDDSNSTVSRLQRIDLKGDTLDPIFVDEYTRLLIKQYYEKPKAKAEIEALAESWSRIFSVASEVPEAFDVDQARGEWLDILGRIAFGFSARDIAGTGQTLTDDEYRKFIRIKIAKNNVAAFMVSDDFTAMQEIIQQLFDGKAYIIDNQDMSVTLYLDDTVDASLLIIANEIDLLPKPQAVRYKAFVSYNVGESFGFAANPDALTWDDKFQAVANPGKFAVKVL